MAKVATVNLKSEMPRVEDALKRLRNALSTHKKQGCKAVILIHGYGSSGVGGKIRGAVRRELAGGLQIMVRDWSGGEDWFHNKTRLVGMCQALADHERHIANNDGITVVVFR